MAKFLERIGFRAWVLARMPGEERSPNAKEMEAFGSALPGLAAAARIWRDVIGRPEDAVREGLAFLRACANAPARRTG